MVASSCLTLALLSSGNACHVPGAVGAISQQSTPEHSARVSVGSVAGAPTSQEASSAEPIANPAGTPRVTLRLLQGNHQTLIYLARHDAETLNSGPNILCSPVKKYCVERVMVTIELLKLTETGL